MSVRVPILSEVVQCAELLWGQNTTTFCCTKDLLQIWTTSEIYASCHHKPSGNLVLNKSHGQ